MADVDGLPCRPAPQVVGHVAAEETDRCTRSGGSGLAMVADPSEEGANGHHPARRAHQD